MREKQTVLLNMKTPFCELKNQTFTEQRPKTQKMLFFITFLDETRFLFSLFDLRKEIYKFTQKLTHKKQMKQ